MLAVKGVEGLSKFDLVSKCKSSAVVDLLEKVRLGT